MAAMRTPGKTATSKISSTPDLNSNWPTSSPRRRSTIATPHFRRSRCSAMGTPPKVEVSRIRESPTKAR